MSTAPIEAAQPAGGIKPFREDGTFRLPLDFTPGRHRPRDAYRRPTFRENPVESLRRREMPSAQAWERARQLTVLGDPLADDFGALYAKLGYQKARELLDAALERGIEHVPDAPPQLKALFEHIDRVPEWVDWERIERGAAAMRRYAPLSALFARLAFAQTYVNANAGMPLYMSGSLGPATVARRLKETDRWRLGIQQPGALRRFADGFKTVVRVRVLHSLVRYHLLSSSRWDLERLGMPIPQLDMAAANTGMLMTHSVLLSIVGAVMTPSELEDVVHLWRYHGYLIGVTDDLNPTSYRDLARINNLIVMTTRLAFDERGGALTRSTMNTPLRAEDGRFGKLFDYVDVRVSHALFAVVNGRKVYQQMQLDGEPRWLWFFPALFPVVLGADTLRRMTPGATRFFEDLGQRYIDSIMEIDEVKNAPFRPYNQSAHTAPA